MFVIATREFRKLWLERILLPRAHDLSGMWQGSRAQSLPQATRIVGSEDENGSSAGIFALAQLKFPSYVSGKQAAI